MVDTDETQSQSSAIFEGVSSITIVKSAGNQPLVTIWDNRLNYRQVGWKSATCYNYWDKL